MKAKVQDLVSLVRAPLKSLIPNRFILQEGIVQLQFVECMLEGE